MTYEQVVEIFETDRPFNSGSGQDRALEGFNILAKHIKGTVIGAAEHDVIYGPSVYDLLETNITEEELEVLSKLGFHIEDDSLAKYV